MLQLNDSLEALKPNGCPRKGGYENITEAKSAIIDYIWGYYQSVRPHRFNDYLSPAEKERLYFNQNLLSGVLN